VQELRFVTRIVHDDVAFLEIRRGEGIDGGDTIVVGVEKLAQRQGREVGEGYFMLPPSAPRLNRYRIRMRISELEVVFADEARKQMSIAGVDVDALAEELKTSGRLALVPIEGRYPRVVIELKYGLEGCKVRILVSKP
jgi:hypothetical protein